MGSPKPLLLFEGRTFLERLIQAFVDSSAEPIVVVLGHGADPIMKRTKWGRARPIVNHNYGEGMLSSIRAGLDALADSPVEGVLVCPVDHPRVTRELIELLIRRFAEEKPTIAVPVFRGRRGHPVLFSREVFAELKAAPDSVGARHVVWKYAEKVLEVKTTGPGATCDIDTPDEYRKLVEHNP
jgi:molybdenum cofactor cytidylyltransferase